jgi:aromatic-L-amino-acid decarboxylase
MGLDAGMTGIIYDTASVSSMHAIAAARPKVWSKHIREEGMSGRPELTFVASVCVRASTSLVD